MPTMNVSLPAEMAAFVEAELASGEYASASEVVREALRLLRRERAAEQERLAILRREIQRGIDDADAGRVRELRIAEMAEDIIARRHE